ncbi:rhomboid family intramembrane serine protease [Thermodesulfatator autotrophicus]|uniref:Peptidase S54 rhomboid domain-containing protein n=1 Tax=Thermodesulfatator autotrophicus TaxID=1795632 RepID=A0A177E5Q5_9BACT|nr:rhomboid family intramembrane serine protease [Thermodesulfatator autotrophicus]OAG26770.1 hypothetical protein TH606_10580 [Thermodesulfatator autotrophicus]
MNQKLLARDKKETIKAYSLVLLARGIEHEISLGEDWQIYVSAKDFEKALEEIRLYQQENSRLETHSEGLNSIGVEAIFWSLCAFGILCVFLLKVKPEHQLFSLGMADNVKFLNGEWWRVFTSLTLHKDPAHLAGNLLFTGIFLFLLQRYLSLGLCWLGLILGGGLGNAWNLFLHKEPHLSVGFSTSTFACLGLLTAFLGKQRRPRRILVSLGLALAFLGFLGSGGKGVDIGAHFWGLIAGFYLGFIWNTVADEKLNQSFNLSGFIVAFSLLIFSWIFAFLNL